MAAEQGSLYIEELVNWLEDPSLLEAVGYLEKPYSGKYNAQEVELAKQVALSAFCYPMLGLGEWGDTEHNLVDALRYRQSSSLWHCQSECLRVEAPADVLLH